LCISGTDEGDDHHHDREQENADEDPGPDPTKFGRTSARLPEGLFDDIIRNDLVNYLRHNQQEQGTGPAAMPRGLRLIAAFKLFKGLVLFAVGNGAVKLLHKDMAFEVERWADIFRVDPNNHYFHRLVERFSILDARKLRELSVGTFFYSALLLTEGTGLLLRKRWAEYFTIIATSSFIPLEVYELTKRISSPRLIVLLLNVVVVVYLVIEVYRNLKNR
jgi:uncharacterized membrane protein (DUF2068 family)